MHADAVVFALGGVSWPQLGSDGAWQGALRERGLDVAPLQPANCGFDIGWSEHFAGRHASAPLKPVVARWRDAAGVEHARQGECVVTQTGIEGSRSEEHTSELQSLMRISYAVFCLKKKKIHTTTKQSQHKTPKRTHNNNVQ